VWDAAKCLEPFSDIVGSLFYIFIRLLEKAVDLEVFCACNIPVVFVELVVEHVRVSKIGIECVDDLLSIVLVKPYWIFFDGVSFLTDDFLGTNSTSMEPTRETLS
jgi:hypothetical protein